MTYGPLGGKGSSEFRRAGLAVVEDLSAHDEEIGQGLVCLGACWRHARRSALLEVIEDFVDEFGTGDVCDDA